MIAITATTAIHADNLVMSLHKTTSNLFGSGKMKCINLHMNVTHV